MWCWGPHVAPPSPAGEPGAPIRVAAFDDARSVALTLGAAYVLRASGEVDGWVWHDDGHLDDPKRIDVLSPARAISADDERVCSARIDGRVACAPSVTDRKYRPGRGMNLEPAAIVEGIEQAKSVAVGYAFGCAVVDDGDVRCWGDSLYFSPKRGASNDDDRVPFLEHIASVAIGGDRSCALGVDGHVTCWGYTPVQPVVVPIDGATQITVGPRHVCAVIPSGLKCWGSPTYGVLGTSMSAGSDRGIPPTDVPGMAEATAVAAGNRVTCATQANGKASCWGAIASRLLVGLAPPAVKRLTPVAGISSATAMKIAPTWGCANSPSGVSCWGAARARFPDHDAPMAPRLLAGDAMFPPDVRRLVGGEHAVCAETADRRVFCSWERPAYDVPGVPDSGWKEPSGVPALENSKAFSLDPIAAASTGGVFRTQYLYTDYGSTFYRQPTDFVDLEADSYLVCGLGSGGSVRCFGAAVTETPLNGVANLLETIPLPGLGDAASLRVRYPAACAIRRNHTLACYSFTPGSKPLSVSLPPLADVVAVDGALSKSTDRDDPDGASPLCAVTRDGKVQCIGVPGWLKGAIASGASTGWELLEGIDDAVDVGVTFDHACVLERSGTIVCIGSNEGDRIGAERFPSWTTTPVEIPRSNR